MTRKATPASLLYVRSASRSRSRLGLAGSLAVLLLLTVGCSTNRQILLTERAPKPAGPFSQAVRVGGTLYVAGQLGIDPATGALVPGGISAETAKALANIKAIVEAAGFSMTDVVSSTVYLTDMADFTAMNQVYALFFPAAPPARATVAVVGLARGAHIEISVIAAR